MVSKHLLGAQMIGIVIVAHGDLGEALIAATRFIFGSPPDGVVAVSGDLETHPDKLRKAIEAGIKSVDRQDGILLLTDMFGGTPSNLAYSFLEEGQVEVLSGVNLPILIKAVDSRSKMKLADLAADLEKHGRQSIRLASKVLKGGSRAKS
jgi:mannose PTS system EIIA component